MRKLLAVAVILTLVFAGCDDDDDGNGGSAGGGTTLTINNQSSYDLNDIRYGSVDLGTIRTNLYTIGNSEYYLYLPKGTSNTKEVEASTDTIYFYLFNESAGMGVGIGAAVGFECSTIKVTCNKNQNTTFTFTNSTVVTAWDGTPNGTTGTLTQIYNLAFSVVDKH
jgi:hypothetical protein